VVAEAKLDSEEISCAMYDPLLVGTSSLVSLVCIRGLFGRIGCIVEKSRHLWRSEMRWMGGERVGNVTFVVEDATWIAVAMLATSMGVLGRDLTSIGS
jgi:hypothetical protein